jgi:hypothetical protein
MSTFAVGEVATLIAPPGARIDPTVEHYIGEEVVVFGVDLHSGHYGVEAFDGRKLVAAPRCLRKHRPPQDWTRLCRLDEAPVDAKSGMLV